MKRIIMLLLIVLLVCGCSPQETAAPTTMEASSDVIAYDFDILGTNLEELGLYDGGVVLTSEEISTQLLLDVALLEDHYVYRHSDLMKASICMVLLPIAGNEDAVKTQMSTFLDMYKDTFDLYAPEEYALVEECYNIDKGDYIIYTISDDNQSVINAINRSKK